MSWWITLEKHGEAVEVPLFSDGGTLIMGGSSIASLNVTYNYSEVTKLVEFHFRDSLHGKTAADTVDELTKVVDKLGTRRFENYWAPTPGNAGHAANILLGWANLHPEAVWRVE